MSSRKTAMIVTSPNPAAVISSSLRYALTESPASRSSTAEVTIAPSDKRIA